MPPTPAQLADWLRLHFGEVQPLRRARPGDVRRLALALESRDLPPDLLSEFAPDALFLHRAYSLGDAWPRLAVLSVHDGFDARLTTGPNWRLAKALGWCHVKEVHFRGKLAGLVATPPQENWPALLLALRAEFGGEELVFARPGVIRKLALLNAMNPALIAQVAGLGVGVYITGQVRPSALSALHERGLGLIALGHRRSEIWGLRRLASELRAAFPDLETRVFPAADSIENRSL